MSYLYFLLLVASITLVVQGYLKGDFKGDSEGYLKGDYKGDLKGDSKGDFGDKCDVPIIAWCETNPCGIHGTCKEVGYGYYCVCDYGYGGNPCELAKTEPTGDSCSSNLDCTLKVKGSICEGGFCYCPYNYKYVADSTPTSKRPRNDRICLRECPENYKLTTKTAEFLRFPRLTMISQDTDKIYPSVAGVEDCKQKCIDENHAGFPCRTIEIINNKICRLHISTVSDYSAQVVNLSGRRVNVESYERPCVKQN